MAAFLAFGAGLAGADPLERGERRSAVQALQLHYRDHDIYFPLNCAAEDGGDPTRTWILCRPVDADGVTGELFTADIREDGLHIWAVNGRAKQHLNAKDGPIYLRDIDQDEWPAAEWGGDPLDIPAALSLF
ncbi:hypothetical protein [Paracoccus aminovorans]|uniref:hypothetical protein n=1 Tax=Paracoccus aminovorans TaxID=34004 RepID=UPI002B25CA15|nr:hypothetical protein [Paracoccus aminovorans]